MSTGKVIKQTTEDGFHENTVVIQGVVTKYWQKKTKISAVEGEAQLHTFVRLAVYDKHTLEGNLTTNELERTPHYVTLLLINSRVDGYRTTIQRHDHITVKGYLIDVVSFETLDDFLVKCRVPLREREGYDKKKLSNIRRARVATYIVPLQIVIHDA